jgi:hypothetical protein
MMARWHYIAFVLVAHGCVMANEDVEDPATESTNTEGESPYWGCWQYGYFSNHTLNDFSWVSKTDSGPYGTRKTRVREVDGHPYSVALQTDWNGYQNSTGGRTRMLCRRADGSQYYKYSEWFTSGNGNLTFDGDHIYIAPTDGPGCYYPDKIVEANANNHYATCQ